MEPVKISATVQEFDGKRYYLCGAYFQRDGLRLHRVVFEKHFGEIPSGHEVHHKDGNRHNNSPGNLELLLKFEHRSHHSKEMHASGRLVGNLEKAREAAKAWHGSAEGREWHRQHFAESLQGAIEPKDFVCIQCGKASQGRAAHESKFCHRNCQAAYRRKSGVDNVDRQCAACGGTFSANRYGTKKFCTVRCAADARKRKE